MNKLLLTLSEAARAAGVSTATWQRLVAAGKAPKPRDPTGHASRWLAREVEAWAEGLPVADHAPPPNCGHNNRPHAKRNRAPEGAPA